MGSADSKIFRREGWLKLDNAAKIYPPVTNEELTSVFRLSCIFTEPVKYSQLVDASEITCARFPYYNSTLRKGLFWYFLEYNDEKQITIMAEEEQPCIAFPVKSNKYPLFRILVRGKRLSVEFMHILTDGGGAIEFMRTLVVTYLSRCGHDAEYTEGIIDPMSSVEESETEDSFKRYFDRSFPDPAELSKAWHMAREEYLPGKVRITEAEIAVSRIREIAKRDNTTITEYLSAVYLFSLQSIFLKEKAESKKIKSSIIRLEVPVNLRKIFPSNTMRNFALFVSPEIDMRMGNYGFEEILKKVHHYMRTETDEKMIRRILKRNVKPESNLFLRLTPLLLKDIVLSAAYRRHGAPKYSGLLTNLGQVIMPENIGPHIEAFSVIPPPPHRINRVSCAILSYRDRLRIVFSNLTGNLELEKEFLSFIASRKIDVKLLNYYPAYGKKTMQ